MCVWVHRKRLVLCKLAALPLRFLGYLFDGALPNFFRLNLVELNPCRLAVLEGFHVLPLVIRENL